MNPWTFPRELAEAFPALVILYLILWVTLIDWQIGAAIAGAIAAFIFLIGAPIAFEGLEEWLRCKERLWSANDD